MSDNNVPCINPLHRNGPLCRKGVSAFGLIVAVLCAYPTDVFATSQVAARTQRTLGVFPESELRRQWSPLVQDIQNILRQLDLYDGANNGALDITTERAIQTYQRRHEIDVDGLPTSALLRHMNGPGRAEALKSKLEAARKTQIAAARNALLKNPATRDLIDANLAAETPNHQLSNPTDNSRCEREPTRDCLLGIALQTAASIARSDYRDWANRDIIRTLAGLGRFDEARNIIKKISDPRLKIVSLRETAVALAHGGQFKTAEQVARLIPDAVNKARAFAAIAAQYARIARPEFAKDAAAEMSREFQAIQDKLAVADIAASLAVTLARNDTMPLAQLILKNLQESLAATPDSANSGDKRAILGMIATAYARIGLLSEAEVVLEAAGIDAKELTYLAIVKYRAKLGDIDRALAAVRQLRQPRHYVAAMCDIAKAQAKASNTAAARATLKRAMNATPDIERPFAVNFALTRLAEAWIFTADFANARRTMRKVGNRVLKARAFWNLAATAMDLGFAQQAEKLKAAASDATSKISSAFDRTTTLIHATQLEFTAKRQDAARRLFQRAVLEASAISGAWWRARIYARLAATMPSL